MKHLTFILMICLSISLISACSEDDDKVTSTVEPNTTTSYKTPKYIFYFIGDGMAQVQINLAEAALNDPDFKGNKVLSEVGVGQLAMSTFPVWGMATTHAEDRYITGSAAAATALACGEKTTINTISMKGDHSGNLTTMAEMAKAKGMKVGIVSSVSIDHATPACFYAHTTTRKNLYDIASQMDDSGFDYFGGGGAVGGIDTDVEQQMIDAGYTIVTTRPELEACQPGTKVWAYNHTLDASYALWYAMDRPSDHLALSEFTEKGIDLLDNDNGFFLMVEGGKVDWACHANDAVASTYDMLAFDAAVKKAVDFYNQHPDETLIVITGDHECGGLTIGFSGTNYETVFDILKYQTESYDEFDDKVAEWIEAGNVTFEEALVYLKNNFALGDESKNESLALSEYELEMLENAFNKSMTGESVYTDEETYVRYGYYDPFTVTATHILNNKAGIDWTSYSHTGVPVPVLAMGQGQYEFSGYYDNTDIAKKIIEICKLK